MSKLVTKHFQVLTKSWIGNNIVEAGSVIPIEHDPDTFKPGPNLKEMPDWKPEHTKAQKEEADAESKRTKERLDNQAKVEKAAEATDKPVAADPVSQRLTFPANPFAVGTTLSQNVAPGQIALGKVEAVNGPAADVHLTGPFYFQVSGQPVLDAEGHSAAATGVAPL